MEHTTGHMSYNHHMSFARRCVLLMLTVSSSLVYDLPGIILTFANKFFTTCFFFIGLRVHVISMLLYMVVFV